MKFPHLILRLEKIFKIITAAAIVLSIIEALIVLFIGIASSNISTENSDSRTIWTTLLISLIIVYAFIIIIKILYNANYPSSIVNELKSQRELEILTNEAGRQRTISEFVVQTIERLNGETCALNPSNEPHLCDTGIQQGVKELIEPIILNSYFLLNTINTNFTVGLYLDRYATLNQIDGAYYDSGVIILNDSLFSTGSEIDKDLLKNNHLHGALLELKTAINKSFNNHEFVKLNFTTLKDKFTIICSPMPYACDDQDLLGVLFIISRQLEITPEDLPTTLTIFNRVISNWIYRYNECIESRIEKINDGSIQK